MSKDKLFLDTHVLVYLFKKDLTAFNPKRLKLLMDCDLRISPIVRLELQYLFEKKNVIYSEPEIVLDYLNKTMDIETEPVQLDSIVSSAISVSWTRDLFDRLIVAHASINNDLLLTRDRKIRKNYGQAVWK